MWGALKSKTTEGLKYPLKHSKIIIGTGEKCDIRIKHPDIAEVHCCILNRYVTARALHIEYDTHLIFNHRAGIIFVQVSSKLPEGAVYLRGKPLATAVRAHIIRDGDEISLLNNPKYTFTFEQISLPRTAPVVPTTQPPPLAATAHTASVSSLGSLSSVPSPLISSVPSPLVLQPVPSPQYQSVPSPLIQSLPSPLFVEAPSGLFLVM